MNRHIVAFLAVASFALSALSANAAPLTRTWVSGTGNDLNPCNRTAPCQTFSGALANTVAGGEINCLDSGGFGSVTISQSVTIDCGDGTGGILTISGSAVVVTAGVSGKVVLRNMTIQGAGTGANAIRLLSGSLTVENVKILGFTTHGIEVNATGDGNLFVRGTNITNVTKGIVVIAATTFATAQIDKTRIDSASGNGLEVGSGGVTVSISNSVITNSGTALITTGSGRINSDRNVIARNTTGVNASAFASRISITRNAFQDNGTAVTFSGGGTVSTASNNTVIGPPGLAPTGSAINPL